MLQTERKLQGEQIEALVKKFGRERNALIPILQELQRRYNYISDFAMQIVADQLNIHPVEVYSVISFYAFLYEKPRGRFIIKLCRTISCDMLGKDRVAQQLENDLGIKFGETTQDGRFSLEWANCIGMCDQGPALLVNDRVYTRVTPYKVQEILEECRQIFGIYALETKEEH